MKKNKTEAVYRFPPEPPNGWKRFYLTKQAHGNCWHYVGDPLHPYTTFDVGFIGVEDLSEIRVDLFGMYVLRKVVNEEECKHEKK